MPTSMAPTSDGKGTLSRLSMHAQVLVLIGRSQKTQTSKGHMLVHLGVLLVPSQSLRQLRASITISILARPLTR